MAGQERRKMNEIARAILDRGLAAYKRDGLLFEPAEPPKTIEVETRKLSKTHKKLKEGANDG